MNGTRSKASRSTRRRSRAFLEAVPFFQKGRRRLAADKVRVRRRAAAARRRKRLNAGGLRHDPRTISPRREEPLAARIVTTSPDVTVSTNLGAWVNRRGLFAREEMADTFRREKIPSTFTWEFSPAGQHIELGIAEMNLFILLSALGLSHSLYRRAAAADRHALRPLHRSAASMP